VRVKTRSSRLFRVESRRFAKTDTAPQSILQSLTSLASLFLTGELRSGGHNGEVVRAPSLATDTVQGDHRPAGLSTLVTGSSILELHMQLRSLRFTQ
jgi:hypothetical protein